MDRPFVGRWLPVAAAALLAACATSFDLQGHRGARGLAPENSLPAFAAALVHGVDTLELDTGVTKDGVVVIHHDSTLNPDITRGPDGRWLAARGPAIHALTYAELVQYDVGRIKPDSAYAKTFPDQEPIDGTRVPPLSELFALVKRSGNTRVRFNIETKLSPLAPSEALAPEPFARALLAEIRRAGMESRVTIQSFDWRTLAVVQKEAPGIPTAYLTTQRTIQPVDGKPSPWLAGLDPASFGGSIPKTVKAAGGTIWSPNHTGLDAAQVSEAHALGLKVIPWTVNEVERMKVLREMGVDGLITDRPDLARK